MSKKIDSARVFSIFVIVIMVLSTLGLFIGGSINSDNQDYNGYKIRKAGASYLLEYGSQKIPFQFHPSELEGIDINNISSSLEANGDIIITFDPNSIDLQYIDLSRAELNSYLTSIGKRTVLGVTGDSDAYSLPIYDCKDNESSLIIILNASAAASSQQIDNNCIYLKGTGYSVLRAVEKIIYSMAGVMG